jgi:hypothetical protein
VAEIPVGFPSELSDDDLQEAIERWIDEYAGTYPTTKLPELLVAFVNAALQERSRREVAASAHAATRAARSAFIVAMLTLAVAITTLVVAIVQ